MPCFRICRWRTTWPTAWRCARSMPRSASAAPASCWSWSAWPSMPHAPSPSCPGPAAACRAGARAGHRSPRLVAGRAALGPGRQCARLSARPDSRLAAAFRRHHAAGHPRPGRGAGHGRPGGGAQDGRLLQIAAPHVLYERPACRAVAEFVGLSTLLPGRVAAPDRVDVGFARLATATGARAPGRAVHVLVRPEHVEADPPPGAPNRLEGRVGAVRYLGAVTRYDFEVPGASRPSRARQPAGRRRHRHRSRAYLPAGRLIPFHLPLRSFTMQRRRFIQAAGALPLAALARRAPPWAVRAICRRRRCTKRRARKGCASLSIPDRNGPTGRRCSANSSNAIRTSS